MLLGCWIKESPRGKYTEKLAKGEVIFSFLLEFPLGLKQRNTLLARLTTYSIVEPKTSKAGALLLCVVHVKKLNTKKKVLFSGSSILSNCWKYHTKKMCHGPFQGLSLAKDLQPGTLHCTEVIGTVNFANSCSGWRMVQLPALCRCFSVVTFLVGAEMAAFFNCL